ncbi:MBL fold metallo-hydrolase [Lysinibacillus sphaericus]|uniref:Beta-lactamase domain-containing protein n=1 Tax=Lysinibacillus sphaericus TaxID=1421 RepID=A0A2S0K199_LYSSH|nr:MBL fold metallo-hydrolase [Lysinibacillus sphaericus]AVK97165.1 MBL fold metallo-hydrolase [Lysinibacillus sphaericus]MED4542453.1 MBL fold metallo-hydrolase [Lysinibacillus sphaericus]TKI20149.1 MBL fold metallo-hydrolase [Lysinibacillus sphaericus]SUV16957.1 beta-lactamase domain-containing protein [Lysinibacillus sphaericus]GEC84371.1 metal-dependent hydrolase [Lysinibacillus sphaericus]
MEILELPIEFEFNGQRNTIYPSLIVWNNELTLVDTGYINFLPLIENEIIKRGYEMKYLKNIIITHYDDDHIGSLHDFKEKYPWINIIASEIESSYLSGEMKSESLVQAEELLENMPPEEIAFGKWFIKQLKELKPIAIDQKVHDGNMILYNECRVVATPGHTSGHISLYFPKLNSVITGDAAANENQQLVIANPHFCLNMDNAKHSLRKIQNLQADTYYCYHGGKIAL